MAAVGAVIAAVLSLGDSPSATTVSERTVTVSRGVIESVVSGSGNLEPARQADVNFAASGRITKIYAAAGEHVSKGDLLARLDDRSAQVAVAKAHADLVDAQDALTDAQEAAAEETAASTSAVTATAAQATPTRDAGGDADPAGHRDARCSGGAVLGHERRVRAGLGGQRRPRAVGGAGRVRRDPAAGADGGHGRFGLGRGR